MHANYKLALSMLGSISAEDRRDIAAGKETIPQFIISVFEPNEEAIEIFRSLVMEYQDEESPCFGLDDYCDTL